MVPNRCLSGWSSSPVRSIAFPPHHSDCPDINPNSGSFLRLLLPSSRVCPTNPQTPSRPSLRPSSLRPTVTVTCSGAVGAHTHSPAPQHWTAVASGFSPASAANLPASPGKRQAAGRQGIRILHGLAAQCSADETRAWLQVQDLRHARTDERASPLWAAGRRPLCEGVVKGSVLVG